MAVVAALLSPIAWQLRCARSESQFLESLARSEIACNVQRSISRFGKPSRVTSVSCFFPDNLPHDFLSNVTQFSYLNSIQLIGSDIGPAYFCDISINKNIHSLQAQMCRRLDDKCLARICDTMPSLAALNISSTAVTDAGVWHISKLHNLEELDLSRTQITGVHLSQIVQNCPKIRKLNLQRSRLNDAGTDALKDCQSLEILNIAWTDLTDQGITRLALLPQLRSLTVWKNPMSHSTAEKLKHALPNTTVTIGPY